MQLYIAEVVSTTDLDPITNAPQFIGRVQIYCAAIHHNVKLFAYNLLPWAQSASCFTSWIPAVGDFVWVYFEKEEFFQNPFYVSPVNFSLPAKNGHNKIIGSITSLYPDVKYLRLPNEVAIGLSANTTTPEISIHHPNAEIYIDSVGAITITATASASTIVLDATGIAINDMVNNNVITMDATGITITGGNKLTVNGTPTPSATGPFNCLGACLFTGSNHAASEVNGI